MSHLDAWWFEPSDGKLRYDDGRKPRKGRTHKVKCEPVLCESGLHASERLIDALCYASSSVVWRVTLSGVIVCDNDKCAATERTYIQRIDAEQILFDFSRWAALQVIHLWSPPAVVRQFLETGDESLRATARDAAWAAARDAARDAAWAAARDAAWAAARDAAWDAAWAAAWDAAWDAARDAARDAQNERLTAMVMAAMEGKP